MDEDIRGGWGDPEWVSEIQGLCWKKEIDLTSSDIYQRVKLNYLSDE